MLEFMHVSQQKTIPEQSDSDLCCANMLTILQVHRASSPTKLDKQVERSRARMPGHQLLQVAPLHALQMPAGL
jgi:hypothetical protein